MPDEFIRLEDCKDRHLYYINSRNLDYGIFNRKTYGFTGIREKMGSVFLFEEYHWDTGSPYGTAKPLNCMCFCALEDVNAGLIIDNKYHNNDFLQKWIEDNIQTLQEECIHEYEFYFLNDYKPSAADYNKNQYKCNLCGSIKLEDI